MLVRLTSSTSGEMIMFAEHAHQLFEILGKECTARGVFSKEQLPDAIARLHRAVEEEKKAAREFAQEMHGADAHEEAGDESKVGDAITLGQRAVPLIHLMEWTAKEEGFILWEAAEDF